MKGKRFEKFSALTEMALQAELNSLSRIGVERKRLENELEKLAMTAGQDVALSDVPDGLHFSAARHKWDLWREKRRIACNQELALIRAEQEQRRLSATMAFGRARALQEIMQRNFLDRKKKAEKP